jgi:hypothetical protein
MQVVVYTTADDVPAHLRCVAHLLAGGTAMPIRFEAETEDGARRRAEQWLEQETVRAKRQGVTAARPALKHRKKSEITEPA